MNKKEEIKLAYEFHNYKTGHCYVEYYEREGSGEKDGYTKIPLYKTSLTQRTESICIKFGRWLLKYATAIDNGNGLCYSYNEIEYNTNEIYKIFIDEL